MTKLSDQLNDMAREWYPGRSDDPLTNLLLSAADDAKELESKLDDAREKNRELNRRCQDAESAARDNVEKAKRSGGSFGRSLAQWAYMDAERRLAEAQIRLDALRKGVAWLWECRKDLTDDQMRERLKTFLEASLEPAVEEQCPRCAGTGCPFPDQREHCSIHHCPDCEPAPAVENQCPTKGCLNKPGHKGSCFVPGRSIMRHKEGCMEWRLTPEGACAQCGAVQEIDSEKRGTDE